MSPVRRRHIYKWELDSGGRRRREAAPWNRLTPARLFVGSFLLLIAVGAAGLRLLPFLYADGRPMDTTDSIFTATSAVCVTGLIVEDTATRFSVLGRAWILGLIQLGGLGIIAFTTTLILALGGRLSLRNEAITASAREVVPTVDYRRLARDVVVFTIVLEAVGALFLWLLWWPRFGPSAALGHAVFHSVSAFCNAGFSTFSDSLMGFDRSPPTLAVVMGLIVAGGLGFLTLEELYQWGGGAPDLRRLRTRLRHMLRPGLVPRAVLALRRLLPMDTGRRPLIRGPRYRISLHSRLVLATTGLLLLGGWVAAGLLEWEESLRGLPGWWDRAVNALFISVTARTAGFNTIDYREATDGTNFLTILLMSIGGSPGSTAGGLKTTTVALPGLLAWARFRSLEITNLWGRTIPEETIQRAVGLVISAIALVIGSLFVLMITEGSKGDFLRHAFEAVSAFNTVGLSMSLTEELSDPGRWNLILLMLLGRVGLPTAAAALTLTDRRAEGEFRYAHEDVVVG